MSAAVHAPPPHCGLASHMEPHTCTHMHTSPGDDEMYEHMKQNHFHCGICQAAGTPHLYFA